jgi:hypothetical protein
MADVEIQKAEQFARCLFFDLVGLVFGRKITSPNPERHLDRSR